MDRRQFLVGSAALVGANSLAAKDVAMLPVIDTHQHLWDLTKFKLGWIKPNDPLAKSFGPKEYAEATAGLNVVKSVYMEVDVVPEQQQLEADSIVALIRSKTSTVQAAVVSGRPDQGDAFKKYVAGLKKQPEIKGVRQVLQADTTPPDYALREAFIAGVRHLGEVGLTFDLCIRYPDLAQMVKLVDACPGTQFVLDHCANGPVQSANAEKGFAEWKKQMDAIASRKNIVVKVSGIAVQLAGVPNASADMLAPVVNHTLDSFGPDRVMFAGDWPVCTLGLSYKGWLTGLQAIVANRSAEAQKKLFHDNAAKFYGI